MKYILAIFTSRKDAMSFYQGLRSHRMTAAVVNTPQEVHASCGISVKLDFYSLSRVKNFAFGHRSFVAFYRIEEDGIRRKAFLL